MSDLGKVSLKGAEAGYILDHPVFKEAFHAVRDSIIRQMGEVRLTDRDNQTRLIETLQILNALERHLRTAMQNGKAADFEMERQTLLQKAGARVRAFLRQ